MGSDHALDRILRRGLHLDQTSSHDNGGTKRQPVFAARDMDVARIQHAGPALGADRASRGRYPAVDERIDDGDLERTISIRPELADGEGTRVDRLHRPRRHRFEIWQAQIGTRLCARVGVNNIPVYRVCGRHETSNGVCLVCKASDRNQCVCMIQIMGCSNRRLPLRFLIDVTICGRYCVRNLPPMAFT